MSRSIETAIDFQQLATLTPDLLCVATLDGYFTWINPQWETALGYPAAELRAVPFLDRVHPADVDSTLEELRRLSEGRSTIRFVNRYRHAEGHWLTLEWMARAGADQLVYASARDITPRRRGEEERRRQHALWELTGSMAHLGYWKVNVAEGTLEWSDEVYAIHGLPKSFQPELEDGINAYHRKDRARVERYVNRAIEYREPFDFRLRLVRPDGEVRQVRSMGRCETDENDEVVSLFGVFQDVTEDVQLRQMNESLEQFSFVASHDLKEPVRTVRSFSELLERNDLDDARRAQYVRYVREAAKRMHALIDDLLEFSRLGRPGELGEVYLGVVLENVTVDLAEAIDRTQATIDIGEMPRVEGDHVRYQQLFSNLISNAIKFRGEEAPDIVIRAEQKGADVELRVADNGIGIEPQFREKVLRPFQRLHGRDEYEGTGIGLSIVQRIVEQNDGTLRIEDGIDGGGTCIVFTLPRSPG